MSIPLFIKDIKNNIWLFLVFALLMSIYLGVIIFMFNPDGLGALNDLVALLPVTLANALGFGMIESSMTGFIASLYYGFLINLFPLVYCVILGKRLVAKFVEDGSFACLLSTPNSRVKLIITQGLYLLISIIMLFIVIFIVGVLAGQVFHPGMLEISVFFELNLGACLMTMAIGMICFFFSSVFNSPRMAGLVGGAICIIFFFCDLLGNATQGLSILKNISLYSLFDSLAIAGKGTGIFGIGASFFLITLILFAGSVGVFQFKKLKF